MTANLAVESPQATTQSTAYGRRVAIGCAIFLAVTAVLCLIRANRLIVTIDEGILFDAGRRMLDGQRVYIDFFSYFGPISYWLQELAFRRLGLTLAAGRSIVIFDFALQCALVYWLIARFGHARAALACTFLFFCVEASNPTLIVAGHRWDSAAISLLSIAFCLEQRWLAAGGLIAAAAFCTPTVGILALITCAWLLIHGRSRALLLYTGAATAVTILVLLLLAISGSLRAFLTQAIWLSHNYSGVNVTPYGYANGNFSVLLGSAASGPAGILLLVFAELPALLPIAAVAGWGAAFWLKKDPPGETGYLLGCLAGYVASCYPRPDVGHLTIVAPLAYILLASLIAKYLPRFAALSIYTAVLPLALVSVAQAGSAMQGEPRLSTPVGDVAVAGETADSVRRLLSVVQPDQSLYVHPYLPLLYFVTQARNPTRYCYLGPGMMTDRDERSVLDDLEKRPPEWILYMPLSREGFLRIFPSAAGRNHRFERIEAWIQTNYTGLEQPLSVSGYELLKRRK